MRSVVTWITESKLKTRCQVGLETSKTEEDFLLPNVAAFSVSFLAFYLLRNEGMGLLIPGQLA